MAMEIRQSFVVKAPPEKVWAFLTDPRRAASALPGAAITEQTDERSFAGTITVKVEPTPTVLCTVISPPMRRANCWLIASPKPVPPYSRVVLLSA